MIPPASQNAGQINSGSVNGGGNAINNFAMDNNTAIGNANSEDVSKSTSLIGDMDVRRGGDGMVGDHMGGNAGAGSMQVEPFASSDGESLESSLSEDTSWISWFCSLKGNEFFCEVDDDFIQDDFNLTGLSSQVTYYNYALDTILDVDIPEGELDERQQELVEVSAETLYGLIHARYILTARGMHAMLNKYNEGAFGRCPRVFCLGQNVLPVGQSDLPRLSTMKVFCPMCWDIYFPRSRHHNTLDGAYWGTSFPHLFLQMNHHLVPQRNADRYVPRVFGFKLHSSSLPVQRNSGMYPGNAGSPGL
ncbi:Casein kinase II subunit beta-1 [Porphyridium purpureum]|uniref:Casein kinase II subunit beta n=1 Tax=Porphyridium purpureum TaxID=35688 RepID=A0A5J4Z9T2_PORPP|nr:Casein kinase II subunit beta-1 [Porphyridium purpureum]|eukprot:POR7154..scf295_1